MFSNLMASAPRRSILPGTPAWGLATILHAFVVSLVFWQTGRPTEAQYTGDPVTVTFVSLPDEPAPLDEPNEPPPAESDVVEAPAPEVERLDVPEGFQQLAPPELLAGIPEPGRVEIRAEDFSGRGIAGGLARGFPLRAPEPTRAAEADLGQPLSVSVVDEAPRLRNRAEISPRMTDLYPLHLRMADIEGQVVIDVVVGSDGRVEAESMKVLSATLAEFEAPTRALVRLMHFEPARRNGRPVRVWIRLPVTWAITRP
jgi:protein TonB